MPPAPPPPQVVRFRLLCSLCYALGERGCASMLMCPGPNEAVLYVPYPARPQRRLGVAAVEYQGSWMYAFSPHVVRAGDVRDVAGRIAALVGAR